MHDTDWLAERFEAQRPRLTAVARRILGSSIEADDAVQEAWLRLSRTDADAIDNLPAWLTTVVSRVCLNVLQSRRAHPEVPFEQPVPEAAAGPDPEHEALLADSIGLALLIVLDTLSPAERVAFVLHDMFAVPFEEIAPIVGRSPAAARQLASRARRRVQGTPTKPDASVPAQREVVDAFFAAARDGDFDALVAVLDPDVVLRADEGGTTVEVHGARTVASRAMRFAQLAPYVRPALINGVAGVVVVPRGRPFSVLAFTVRGGRIAAIDALADRERLAQLDLTPLDD